MPPMRCPPTPSKSKTLTRTVTGTTADEATTCQYEAARSGMDVRYTRPRQGGRDASALLASFATPLKPEVDGKIWAIWRMRENPSSDPGRKLRLALFQPDIAQNTGTMLRLAACLGVGVDVIQPTGFDMSDKALRRSALDYLEHVELQRHVSWADFEVWRRERSRRRLVLLTTRADISYLDFAYRPDDIVMVGRESAGVPDVVHQVADARVRVPILPPLRSLNVAVAAAMTLGEALRQLRLGETA